MLVRSILAAKKARPGSTEKETAGASNIQSDKEIPLEGEQTQFSQYSVPSEILATITDPGPNSAAESTPLYVHIVDRGYAQTELTLAEQ